jgi:Ca2+-binding RTX toxin-like protein
MATISGSQGNDTITPATVTGGVTGGPPTDAADSILGFNGADSIDAGGGNDTLRGGAGFDILIGGAGDDVISGGADSDIIDGSSGFDIVTYDDILPGSPILATIAVNAVGTAVLGNNATVSGAASGTDQLVTIEQITGTAGNDTFVINSVNTDTFLFYVQGGAGNDSMAGPAALNRGLLLDYLAPGVTSGVSVNLGTGRASDGLGGIDSFSNFNAVRGSALGDTLIGSANGDRFRGRGGNDSIDGGGGFDLADYSQTTGAVSVNLATGRAQDGDGGTDTLVSIEQIRGSSFADTLIGSGIGEGFRGNAGGDTIDGGGGIDTIDYGSATGAVSVNLFAGRAFDGQGGTDSFANVEYVLGGNFNDNLIGLGAIAETLNGAAGDDVLSAFGGNDVLIGGSGFDLANYSGQNTGITASVVFNGTSGHTAIIVGAFGTDTAFEIEAINGTTIGDRIEATSLDPVSGLQLRGFGGNDTLIGSSGRSTGIQVDYRVTGVTSGVSVDLAAQTATDGLGGQDSLVNISYVRGTDFADTMFGTDGTDRFRSRAGSDFLDARGGDFDILDLAQATGAVSVNLVTQRAQDGEGGIDTVIGFEEVRATTGADTLIGSGRAEIFLPFNGDDRVNGGGGQDRVTYDFTTGNVPAATRGVTVNLVTGIAQDGWGGTDTLIDIERVTGTAFADSILGDSASNRFRGQAGNDTLNGGLGGDFVEYNNAPAGVTVNLTTRTASDGQGGTDLLVSIEHVIGSAFADRLTGVAQGARSASDLRGGAGNDTLVGINGQYVRADYADQTVGLSINLAAGSANDGRGGTDTLINIRGLVMFGDHADTLLGSAFGEWFSPSLGADSVNAGAGFDILSYAGADTAGVSVNLATGRARDHGGFIDTVLGFDGVAGSFTADTIIGSGFANLIGPAGGADSVNAGAGDDTVTYSLGFSPGGIERGINEAGDRLPVQGVTVDLFTGRATDYGGAIDTILGFENAIGGTANDILRGTNLANALGGEEGNDTLEGRDGNDTLDGGLGVDRLVGGLDDDTYILDATADLVVELADQGSDTILAARASVVMAAHVEAIIATGDIAHAFTGNTLDNVMVGGTGNDTLNGGAGNDTLDGGGGTDRLVGGLGDDVYLLPSDGAVTVIEALNQGIDTVFTGRTAYVLGLNVENLVGGFGQAASLTGNTLANLIVGGDSNDTLNGGAGNDTLAGGLGADSLFGGTQDDFYVIDTADRVIEGLNQGIDTVSIETGALHNLAGNVEVLVMTGNGVTTGNGNALDNTILGGDGGNVLQGLAGADLLSGLGGNDILVGGAGRDTLLGGAGNDQFRFLTDADSAVATPDRIADFSFVAGNLDRIALNFIDADTTVALDQAFVYRGALGFTGTAGELRVESLGGGVYRASGDVNRDQLADFAIDIVSATGPVQNWFIL